MKVDIIHSGSSGNCAVIDDLIVIDAGWNVTPEGKYLLLTHHHSDHTKHIDKMVGMSVFCSELCAMKLKEKHPYMQLNIMKENFMYGFSDGDCTYYVTSKGLKHDAPCVGFDITKVKEGEMPERIFFATDFNEIVERDWFVRQLRNKEFDALYIECNNTLSILDFNDVYFVDENEKPPKDEFHRRKSFENHCNVEYLIELFEDAGYSAENRFTEPVTLLHKSSYYYLNNIDRIVELTRIANIINPLM